MTCYEDIAAGAQSHGVEVGVRVDGIAWRDDARPLQDAGGVPSRDQGLLDPQRSAQMTGDDHASVGSQGQRAGHSLRLLSEDAQPKQAAGRRELRNGEFAADAGLRERAGDEDVATRISGDSPR